ncbi:DUF2946 family protein [Variovorax sp. VNK109]|jgi:hypothetical protein|uniref:DUF2946 family protein n=1 Tax=Variovorax sp. VNK109 TaxID=3400919 RepID=UPI003BFBDC8C
MDDIVRQAIAKWPNVPHCYGWLGLDARGHWYMRDDKAQAAGPFAAADGGTPASRGSLLRHEKLIAFIHRNYDCDAQGQWFFQNGPQRVYVELEITPLVWRVSEDFAVTAHTGQPARVQRCLLDEAGHVYVEAEIGLGLVHTLDVPVAAQAVEQGLWVPQEVALAELPRRFGFVRSPAAVQAAAQTEKAGH